MSKIEVFYEDWQYDCCGTYFSVGEYIWWHIERFDYKIKINNKNRFIKYFFESHGNNLDRYISGKVKKIEAIRGDEYIECQDTSEIKKMGYSFIVTIDEVEEFFYNDIKELNNISNPFIKNRILNEKNVYTKINIIGDLNNTALEIAKKFNENHYGINFYYKNKRKYKEYYNELKNIRSYSRNEYYDINVYDISKNKQEFTNALNIIISDKNDYTYFYNFLLELKKEHFFSTFNICYINSLKENYEISFDYSKLSRNIFHLLKKKNVKYKKTDINYKKTINTEGELIDFLCDKTYKKIKFINYKKRILFFFILWVIIKIITYIVRF